MLEKDLCNALITELEGTEFRVFNEYSGWDMVISHGNLLFGVQAKLKLNKKAIAQTLNSTGVDFKIILVENYRLKMGDDFITILNALNIMLVSYKKTFSLMNSRHWGYDRYWAFSWRHHPKKRLEIPDFDYDTPAGVSSPRLVTNRNINLVRLELFALEHGGKLTLAQIKSFGFKRVPTFYFYYHAKTKLWYLNENPKKRPSADYPHIYKGLTK